MITIRKNASNLNNEIRAITIVGIEKWVKCF